MDNLTKAKAGDYVGGTFVIASIEQKEGARGGPFLTGKLQNRFGVMPFKKWKSTLDGEGVGKGNVVTITATLDIYEGSAQLIVLSWDIAADTDYTEADLVPHSPIDSDILWSDMLAHIERIEDDGLRGWLSAFVAEKEARIRRAPAAMVMHHAYAGGLLEHINGLCRAAEQIATVYDVDLDVLTAGCVLHDIGKIFELEAFPSLDYTTIGNLVGHVAMGITAVSQSMLAWNTEAVASMKSEGALYKTEQRKVPIAQQVRYHVMHIIASHHGTAEHGAVRPPATLEAMVFHHLDMIDSRAWMFAKHIADHHGEEQFTGFHRGLEARLWKVPGRYAQVMEDPDGN